ncbi:hypothetical protein [Actinoallomurus sp. CA-150999]|uniref:hypothetical protein n=1 Tax=Actinoallomurus sp. CA-150999 TaxID=3239887 RepID=UPI003D8F9687
MPVSNIGDEARLLAATSDEGNFVTVTVVARRWNVVVNIAYTLDGPHKQEQAARMAYEAARVALAAVQFR